MNYNDMYKILAAELDDVMTYDMTEPGNLKVAADTIKAMKKAALLCDMWSYDDVDAEKLKMYHDGIETVVQRMFDSPMTPAKLTTLDDALEAIKALRMLLGLYPGDSALYREGVAEPVAQMAKMDEESEEKMRTDLMGEEFEGFKRYKQSYRQTGNEADRTMMFQELDHLLTNSVLFFTELKEEANGAGERNMIATKVRDIYALYN